MCLIGFVVRFIFWLILAVFANALKRVDSMLSPKLIWWIFQTKSVAKNRRTLLKFGK